MSSNETHYHIADDTNIANISLKQLLSHVELSNNSQFFLSEYVISELEQLGMDYVDIL